MKKIAYFKIGYHYYRASNGDFSADVYKDQANAAYGTDLQWRIEVEGGGKLLGGGKELREAKKNVEAIFTRKAKEQELKAKYPQHDWEVLPYSNGVCKRCKSSELTPNGRCESLFTNVNNESPKE